METLNTNSYNLAKARVDALKSFYNHLFSYVVVLSILLAINLATTSFLWVVFPALGWGIGILIHALRTFSLIPFLNKNWEMRKIQELMQQPEKL